VILIKNVKVIDGTGKPAYPADVLVVGDKISAIGNFPHRQADQVIEGLGGYLTPGFIDVGTEADHYLDLLTNPAQENYLLKGVTTIIGGRCGSSLAPLIYGTLESIRKWTDIDQVNVNWGSIEEFLRVLKKLKPGVNFGTLVGHSTIRRALLGDDQRELTEKEIKVFQTIIRESLEAGALGFSTGLSFIHSYQTPYRELRLLTAILNPYNAIYVTHLRNEKENIYSSVNEVIKLYKETGIRTLISHFHPLKGLGGEFDTALDLIDKAGGLMDIYFDINLSETNTVPIYTLLPLWAQKGNLEVTLEYLRQPSSVKRILKELPKFNKGDLVIFRAVGNKFLENKEIADKKELLEIMQTTKLRALLSCKNIDYRRLEKLVFHNKALITHDFIKFLDLVSQKKDYPIEKAVEKITGLAAQKFNIKNRGEIKEGNFADLTLLLNNQVQYVIINGQVGVYKRAPKEVAAGHIISR